MPKILCFHRNVGTNHPAISKIDGYAHIAMFKKYERNVIKKEKIMYHI